MGWWVKAKPWERDTLAFYRMLGGPVGRSGRERKISP